MQQLKSRVVWPLLAAGIAALVWVVFAASADESATVQAAERGTAKSPNLSLWVPEEELKVWDPVNPNVNPIPWRVFGPIPGEGKRSAAFRHTAIDEQVRVEGLAWGYDVETELPTSRVVFEGGTVLVEGVDFTRPDVRGKTVCVEGVLRLGWMPHRGFERQFPRYYFLEAASFEVIEQVTDPHVILVP